MKSIQERKVFCCIGLLILMHVSSIFAQEYILTTNWNFINEQSLQADEKVWKAAESIKALGSLKTLDNVIIIGESGGKRLYFNGYITSKKNDHITVATRNIHDISSQKLVAIKKANLQPGLEEKNRALYGKAENYDRATKRSKGWKEPQDPEFIEQLLDAGADIYAAIDDHYWYETMALSPLLMACFRVNLRFLETIESKKGKTKEKINWNAHTPEVGDGLSPLIWACMSAKQRLFEFLLPRLTKEEINLKIKDRTPLSEAVKSYRSLMVEKLLDKGANTSGTYLYDGMDENLPLKDMAIRNIDFLKTHHSKPGRLKSAQDILEMLEKHSEAS